MTFDKFTIKAQEAVQATLSSSANGMGSMCACSRFRLVMLTSSHSFRVCAHRPDDSANKTMLAMLF